MDRNSFEETLRVLGEACISAHAREEAHRILNHMDTETKIPLLVQALQSDNVTVRWEAAKVLSEMGRPALIGVLNALVDPKKVGDPRLRSAVYHILRNQRDPAVRKTISQLGEALHGSAADLMTMREAHHMLQEIGAQRD